MPSVVRGNYVIGESSRSKFGCSRAFALPGKHTRHPIGSVTHRSRERTDHNNCLVLQPGRSASASSPGRRRAGAMRTCSSAHRSRAVVKPFAIGELLARLRAALRRSTSEEVLPKIETPELSVDLEKRIIDVRGERVHLSPKEFDVLRLLVIEQGKPLTHKKGLTGCLGTASRRANGEPSRSDKPTAQEN